MMRMLIIVGVIWVSFFASSSAQEQTPANRLKSDDAKKAIADYNKAIKEAQDTFDKNVEAARKTFLADLEAAQEKAAKDNELDDAVLIRDIRREHGGATAPAPGSAAKAVLDKLNQDIGLARGEAVQKLRDIRTQTLREGDFRTAAAVAAQIEEAAMGPEAVRERREKENIVKKLVNRPWNWYWDGPNRDTATMYFRVDGSQVVNGSASSHKVWTLERQWVVRWPGHHLLFLNDDQMIGAFEGGHGRLVGAFGGPKK